jgi:tetratricopeptide (TPR) repeat protein
LRPTKPSLALLMILFVGVLLSQTPAGENQAAQMPADMRAFSEANSTQDLPAKIEGLCKFLEEYPNSDAAPYAVGSLIRAVAKAWPDNPTKMTAIGDRLLTITKGGIRGQSAQQVAAALMASGKLEDAERFARIGVDEFTIDDFKKTIHGDEEIVRGMFTAQRAGQLVALAQVERKLGKGAEARRLLEEAMRDNPGAAAARGLADLSADPAEQLHWTTAAYVTSSSKTDRDRAEALYKKTHNDSLDGMEAVLDAEYNKLFPNPAHLERYHGKGKRTVLAELLTGSGCGPCIGQDLAFDALLERYSKTEVSFLLYHQNRPSPDPMTFPASMARYDYYRASGVPTVAIDGKAKTGGVTRAGALHSANESAAAIDAALQTEPGATLELQASRNGQSIPVNVKIAAIAGGAAEAQLHIVVAENMVRYTGENGIRFHPMVVRSVFQVPVQGGEEKKIDHVFDIGRIAADLQAYHDAFEKHDARHNPDGTFRWRDRLEQIDARNLTVVAFLQDDRTGAILQSASVDLSQGGGSHSR